MTKIEREKETVEAMIHLYCRLKEGNKELCPQCEALVAYAHARLDSCKFGEDKKSCEHCPVHCYKPAMREQIRQVMRYAGPRMLLYHPIMALRHFMH